MSAVPQSEPQNLRTKRLAVFHPPGRFAMPRNPFGKDVANLQLFRALAQHGGFDTLDVLTVAAGDPADASRALRAGQDGAAIETGSILTSGAGQTAGAVLRGQPYLDELAWLRRLQGGDAAFSLIGLIHTLAPPAVRERIGRNLIAPIHPWDALICTSPSVRDNLTRMFEVWGEHLAARTGGAPPPQPALPLIPLGVEGAGFAAQRDRPAARAALRAELGLAEDDVLITWIGRLSFFEKAFPQPMFKAVQQALAQAKTKGYRGRVHFAMAGWFPQEQHRAHYLQSAAAHAPDVPLHLLDGNDQARVADLWAGADIFLSLVDNIQETFGITPLEAMASGLPVVVSDWDGYRFTVRDGVEGFLIPTLGGPSSGGLGAQLAARHAFDLDSYQTYAGTVAQHTAVHVGRAAAALADLIASAALRERMGAAGRERIRTTFDWPVVARQVAGLTADLAQIRAAALARGPRDPEVRVHPFRGDPFIDFAGFATTAVSLETRVRLADGVVPSDVRPAQGLALDGAFPGWRSDIAACERALTLLAERPGLSVREVLEAFEVGERRRMEMALVWMAKLGLVDWLA